MAKLTTQIKQNKELKLFLQKLIPKLQKNSQMDQIKNPLPTYIVNNKLWSLMGTYTDYMIRKMFEELFQDVKKEQLICEISYKILKSSEFIQIDKNFLKNLGLKGIEKKIFEYPSNDINSAFKQKTEQSSKTYSINAKGFEFRKRNGLIFCRSLQSVSIAQNLSKEIKESYSNLRIWIEKYKDHKTSWKDVIDETFYIAQTDSLFRAGILRQRLKIPDEYEKDFYKFFQNIWEYLPNLKIETPLILNPALGIINCSADADFVDSNCIFDIKTSKYLPKQTDLFQLLGYSALFYHKYQKRVNFIAIFNPIFLGLERYDISDINSEDLEKIIQIISKV